MGTTSRGGQPVFGTSSAKASKKGAGDRAAATTPSTRSAAGDLWSGFEPNSRSSVFAAEASAPRDGVGAPVALLAALGLGLAGAAGAMSFAMLRSRRAKSKAAGGRGTSEM